MEHQGQRGRNVVNKYGLLSALAVLTAVLATGAVACDADEDGDGEASATEVPAAEIPVVDVTITDQGYNAPASVPGGLTRTRAHNQSTLRHAAGLVLLKDG